MLHFDKWTNVRQGVLLKYRSFLKFWDPTILEDRIHRAKLPETAWHFKKFQKKVFIKRSITHKNTRRYKHKYHTSGVGDPVLLVQYSGRGETFKYTYKYKHKRKYKCKHTWNTHQRGGWPSFASAILREGRNFPMNIRVSSSLRPQSLMQGPS